VLCEWAGIEALAHIGDQKARLRGYHHQIEEAQRKAGAETWLDESQTAWQRVFAICGLEQMAKQTRHCTFAFAFAFAFALSASVPARLSMEND
jgi:hypothetical protein